MAEKNKKLEIASAIVGGLYAAIHIALAVIFITEARISGEVNTEGMGIFVFFYFWLQILIVSIAIDTTAFAIWCVAAIIIPLRAESVKTIRRVAIANIVFLVLRMIIDVNFVFGFIVNGFRDGDYLRAILTILFIILTITWFVLNIIRAKIYKNKDRNK